MVCSASFRKFPILLDSSTTSQVSVLRILNGLEWFRACDDHVFSTFPRRKLWIAEFRYFSQQHNKILQQLAGPLRALVALQELGVREASIIGECLLIGPDSLLLLTVLELRECNPGEALWRGGVEPRREHPMVRGALQLPLLVENVAEPAMGRSLVRVQFKGLSELDLGSIEVIRAQVLQTQIHMSLSEFWIVL